VVLRSDHTILDGAGRTRFVCAMFTYHHVKFKGEVDSYLCMTLEGKTRQVPHDDSAKRRVRCGVASIH
jgi:hypothetical protein